MRAGAPFLAPSCMDFTFHWFIGELSRFLQEEGAVPWGDLLIWRAKTLFFSKGTHRRCLLSSDLLFPWILVGIGALERKGRNIKEATIGKVCNSAILGRSSLRRERNWSCPFTLAVVGPLEAFFFSSWAYWSYFLSSLGYSILLIPDLHIYCMKIILLCK
jgi:hypothetical protein